MHDICGLVDIRLLIDTFYDRVRKDELLAPIFSMRIPDERLWPHHLQIMYNFWNTVLFAEPGYRGNPFSKHVGLGIQQQHFDRWISLFHGTVDELFSGEKADETKDKAVKMRQLFEIKLSDAAEGGARSIF